MDNDRLVEGLLQDLAPRFSAKIKEAIETEGGEGFLANGYDGGIYVAFALLGEPYGDPFADVIDDIATDRCALEPILWRSVKNESAIHRAETLRKMVDGLDTVKAGLRQRYAEAYGEDG